MTRWIPWALGAAVFVLLLVLFWTPIIGMFRDQAVTSKAGKTFAEARTDSAVETTRIVIDNSGAETAVRDAVENAINEIQQQEGADKDAGPAGAAGLNALCGLLDYRDRPGCGLQ